MKILVIGFICSGFTALSLSAQEAGEASAIPFHRLGMEAQKLQSGDEAAITPTAGGSLLRAAFQDLEAEATAEGLWLRSTAGAEKDVRFRVRAVAIGRDAQTIEQLPLSGTTRATDAMVSFVRPGLTEEYSVTVDGVRQDFLVAEKPSGEGKLIVTLESTGARASAAAYGAKLTLDRCGREIAYHRLHVTDATGRELEARIEVPGEREMRVVVDDRDAAYPVRIDPTFCDSDWISMGGTPGTDGAVLAIAPDTAGNLYVGGTFTTAGGVPAANVAKWDGSSWSAMGDGVFGTVRALAVSGSLVYAGGDIGGGVGCWNGYSWSPLREGTNGPVLALTTSGSTLYVGGNFTTAGSLPAANIARWSGGNWSALGSGTDGAVNTMVASGGNLYIGGAFNSADGVSGTSRVARWSGSAWQALGSGMNGNVEDLVIGGDYLYAGGQFTQAGGIPALWLARWHIVSSGWSAIAHPASGTLLTTPGALAWSGGQLYVGTTYVIAADTHTIVKWNPGTAAWSTLAATPNNPVQVLTAVGGQVYAGGGFSYVGATGASNIARFDGSAWHGMGGGFNGPIHALAALGTDLYVGGLFRSTPTGSAQYIAKWNGSTWSALGSGTNGGVSALAVWNGSLYVGGDFTHAGGLEANHVARWIPGSSSWSLLVPPIFGTSAGTDGPVYALVAAGTKLYVGGSFSMASDLPHEAIAAWDGASWSALGTGVPGTVKALAVLGGDLFVGGNFPDAGGAAGTQNIARWNSSAWSALASSGTDGGVRALAVSGSNLYVGGIFSQANSVPAANVARWNGGAWSPLGAGTAGAVNALAVSGNDLFAGGDFTIAGATAADHIAKWDSLTSEWSGLGTGINGTVNALAVSGGRLHAGGDFTIAGGKISPMLASTTLARYSDGSLDEEFGSAGMATTSFGSAVAICRALAIQSDGKVISAGNYTAALAAITRHNHDGSPDLAFGGGAGKVATAIIPGGSFQTRDVASLPDGKILLLGQAVSSGNGSFAISRLNPDGSPDLTFNGGGAVITAFAGYADALPEAMTVQTDGKILVAGTVSIGAGNSDLALVRYWSDGTLDSTFNGTGIITLSLAGYDQVVGRAVRLLENGKILVAGTATGLTSSGSLLARFHPNGSADTSFQATGVALVPEIYAYGMNLQTDGKILLAGVRSLGFSVARCHPDGSIDLSFNGTGVATAPVLGALPTAYQVAAQADGKILVAGYGGSPSASVLVRFQGNGGLDLSFNGIGYSVSPARPGGWVINANGGGDKVDCEIAPSGDIYLSGMLYNTADSSQSFALMRYAADPEISLLGNSIEIADGDTTPDPADDTDMGAAPIGGGTSKSFIIRNTGSEPLTLSGGPTTRVTISPADGPFAIAAQYVPETIDPCGGETFFSVTFNPTLSEHVGFQTATVSVHSDDDDESPYTFTVRACGIASVSSDGRLDTTFDSDGKVTTALGGLSGDFGYAAAEQSDGKIVVAGSTNSGGNADFLLARYRLDGSLDPDFGTGGIVTTPVGTGSDTAWAVRIQPDGKILAAGSATTAGNEDFALARYLPDGTPDPAFGTGGKVTTDLGGFSDIAFALALQNDGLIVVAGRSFNGSNQDFAVVRYLPNGVVDATFAGGGGRFNFTGGNDEAHEVLVQGDGMIVLAGSSGDDFGLLRLDAYGVLDPAFGSFGKVTTDFGGASDQGYGAVIVDEINILVAGASNGSVALAQYLADGTLDPAFGTGGKTTSHSGIAYDVALQSDGKIVTGGWYWAGSHSDFLLARFLANGSPDTTLDGDGIVTVNLTAGLPNDTARAVIPTCDGQLVLAGTSQNGIDSDIALTRHAGAPVPEIRVEGNTRVILSGDTTPSRLDHTDFGSVGLGSTLTRTFTIRNTGSADLHLTGGIGNQVSIGAPVGSPFTVSAQPASDIVPPGGTLTFNVTFAPTSLADIISHNAAVVIPNDDFDESACQFVISAWGARFSDGTPDTTFGTGGVVADALPGFAYHTCEALAALPDGGFLLGGEAGPAAGAADFALARYKADGTLDSAFGLGGIVLTEFEERSEILNLHVLDDGRILATGITLNPGPTGGPWLVCAVRYMPDGGLDWSFGSGGKMTLSPGNHAGFLWVSSAVQEDDKIVVATRTHGGPGGTDRFCLIRLHPDGALDPGFGSGGFVKTDFGSGFNCYSSAVVVMDDDRIVVAGNLLPVGGFHHEIGLACYLPSGALDPSFGGDGKVTTRLPVRAFTADRTLIQQPDGKLILLATSSLIEGPLIDYTATVLRYLEDGTLDTTGFGGGDAMTTAAMNGWSMALQDNGGIMVAGTAALPAATRFLTSGIPDTDGFGNSNAMVQTDPGGSLRQSRAVAVDRLGRLLIAGLYRPTGETGFIYKSFVARFAISDSDIAVSGNGVDITAGDTTPDIADHSDFGSTCAVAGSVERVFTIANSGPGNLNLTGSPRVAITGEQSDDFTVAVLPSSPVADGASTTFTIIFDPSDAGLRTATVSIACDDPDENPFTFAIQGTGLTHAEVFEQKMLAAGLAAGNTAPLATPFGDGVPNLLKYAFNLDLTGPDVRTLPAGGTAGLPRITLEGSGAARVLRFEFVGRADCLELTYAAKKSTELAPDLWLPLDDVPLITPLVGDWARIVYEEPAPEGTTPRLFGRVEVELP